MALPSDDGDRTEADRPAPERALAPPSTPPETADWAGDEDTDATGEIPSPAPGCLSPRDIQDILETRLSSGSGVRMEEHIARCLTCRREFEDQREFAELRRLYRDRQAPAPVPPVVPGHAIEAWLGQGGFGHVWSGHDLVLGRPCAYKMLHGDRVRGADRDDLIDEARVMAGLAPHPNRVQVHHLLESGDDLVMVMGLVPGGPLSRLPLPLPWYQALRYLIHACLGLEDLHRRGLLHRDIKPSNLLLNPDGDVAVVGDYGLAAFVDEPTALAGTSGYLAPELLDEPPSDKSDVFALAVTLFTLTTGANPFDTKDPYQGLIQAREEGWASLAVRASHLPDGVQEVIREGIDPDPRQRPDLAEFLFLLRRADQLEIMGGLVDPTRARRRRVGLRAEVSPVADTAAQSSPLAELRADDGVPAQLVELSRETRIRLKVFAEVPGHITVLGVGAVSGATVLLPGPRRPFTSVGPDQPLPEFTMTVTPADPGGLLAVIWTDCAVSATGQEWRERILSGFDPRQLPAARRGEFKPLHQEDPFQGWSAVVFRFVPAPNVG